MFKFSKLIFTIIGLIFVNSCAYKNFSHNIVAQKVKTPVFIQMPENSLVFQNVSNLVYKSIYNYFARVGYRHSNSTKNAFVFKVKIKRLEPVQKFISPDLLLYDQNITLELDCSLFDVNNKLLASKSFSFFTLLSKPKNPILNSGFLDYEYTNLLRRSVPKVEQYFRKYFIK